MIRDRSYSKNIMIVDDEPANLKLLDRMLQQQGYRHLTLIDDPFQVLPRYKMLRPELILLDINMPGMSGFDVMKKLFALEDPLLPPIVIITAQDSREFRLQALSSGARDFITKPFDRNELLMRVHNLLDAQLAHLLLHNQNEVLEELVRQRTEELNSSRLVVIRRLGMAAEYRDEETGSHILRMSHTCAELAKARGWSESACELILHASPMHDVGKIGIPDAILLKPGKLNEDEWKIMKTHTEIGGRLLEDDGSTLMSMAREIALTHHEKWDGSGYPNGLKGEEIPEVGRIAAVSDVFDALTSERPYKKAWSVEEALDFMVEQKGRHFCPLLVDTLILILPKVLEIRERFAETDAISL